MKYALRALLIMLALLGSAHAADSLTQAAGNLIGTNRTTELTTVKVVPDPDCVADATIADKTKCHRAVIIVGKMQVYLSVAGAIAAAASGGVCWSLDTDKAATDDSYQVTPSSSTSTSRPIYRISDYLASGALKEIGRAPNGTPCSGPLIAPTKSYRSVTVGAVTGGMALCGLVPGKQLFTAHEEVGFGDEMVKYKDTGVDDWCKNKLAGVPAPAPVPAPIAVSGGDAYTFYCTSDDGCRVWVNGVLVVDNWRQQAATEASGSITLPPGKYPIKVEYFDATGGAEVHLAYSSANVAKQVIPAAKLSNLAGMYFNTDNFTGPALQRLDANIDFNWGNGAPMTGINADHFSVRWLGDVTVP